MLASVRFWGVWHWCGIGVWGGRAMLDDLIVVLDWLGVIVFTLTGALVAARNQMDLVGFVLLGTVTGIGGCTLRDVLLGIHPLLWIGEPAYVIVCAIVSTLVFFTAHLVKSRIGLLLWLDALGLALFAVTGAERAIAAGSGPIVAIVMGVITACFGGIIRDTLSGERSIIFSREIYVTAALLAATSFVAARSFGVHRDVAVVIAVLLGFALRGGALRFGWSLPRYHARPPAG
jgi:uncharacterized membrane protein YeiH